MASQIKSTNGPLVQLKAKPPSRSLVELKINSSLPDPIDDLTQKLESLHIGTRWRIVQSAAPSPEEKLNVAKSLLHVPISNSGPPSDASSDVGEMWEDNDTKLVVKMVGFLATVIAMPSFLPALLDEIADEGQASDVDAASYAFMPLGRKGLPDPKPKFRPCWEPPILAYTEYEEALQAHKTICEREGSTNVTWRTHALDHISERSLLVDYWDWAEDSRNDALEHGRYKEAGFLRTLRAEIAEDQEELRKEAGNVRGLFDSYHLKLIEEIKLQRHIKRESSKGAPGVSGSQVGAMKRKEN